MTANTKIKILDIAMNLNRIGNWAADGFQAKEKRILTFLDQTSAKADVINCCSFSRTSFSVQ